MTKKLLVVALALVASTLIATSAFGQTGQCAGGVNILFNGVGSSAQANSLAQAAKLLTQNTSLSPSYNLVSASKGVKVFDNRPKTGAVSDGANPFWVTWGASTTKSGWCDVYAYSTIDSGAGVKDFFAYEKFTNGSGKVYTSLASSYLTLTDTGSSGIIGHTNVIPGLPDTQDSEVGSAGSDFELIEAALNVQPETRVASGNVPAPAYCGNLTTTTAGYLTQWQCYFNAGATDIRPEDALYATTRALTSYNGYTIASGGTPTENVITKISTGLLSGEGYNQASNASCTGTAQVGCTLTDAFGQGKTFNVVTFKLTTTDPLKGGTLPAYTTLSTGAAPQLVIARNGSVFGTTDGSGNYIYNDINRQALSQIFSGATHCTGDLLSNQAGTTGSPIQAVLREPLSGTYNTFEFTAVRTILGGSNPLTLPATNGHWPPSNADNGQEQFNDPLTLPGGNGTNCALTGGQPQANCFNPLFSLNPVNECTGTTGSNPGLPVRLRAIGTGESVAATIGTYNASGSAAWVDNSLGYAFWSYGNLDPLCSGYNATTATTSCTGGGGTYIGHYLTVDGIDPLFASEGGQYDRTDGAQAYNPPFCNVAATSTVTACLPIPFKHIKDGKYPLWSLLRVVTFAPVTAKIATPIGVLNMIAEEEISTQTDGLSDFVPFLTNVTGSTATGVWNGDLNLFVYRSHYTQSAVTGANGHKGCGTASGTAFIPPFVFTGIRLQGGTSTKATCLVDFGGDMGGAVLTVQSDVDWYTDWSAEEYFLHQ